MTSRSPTADDGLLVRVHASSVHPVDAFIAAGALQGMAEYEFPVTLGRDFAGVVEQVGSGVSRYRIGDEVLRRARAQGGSDRPGRGAAGRVASFFVQLAAAAGATVVAAALPEDEEYLRALGVGELVDWSAALAAAVRGLRPDGVDAILDVVSPVPDASLLKHGGRLASTIGAAGDGPGRFNLMADPAPANLQRLAALLDTGGLRVPIQRSYRLEQAGEALQTLPAAHTQGKLSVTLP